MPYPLIAGPLTLTSVASSVNPPGTAIYTGTITGGTANAFAGMLAQIVGFPEVANGSNNSGPGGYLVVNSSATTLTVNNPVAVAANATAGSLNLFSANAAGPWSPPVGGTIAGGSSGNSVATAQPPAPGSILVEGAPVAASLTPRNFQGGWNFVNSEMTTQKVLDTQNVMNGTQQGTPVLTNVTAVTLAGYAPGTLSFVQFTGGYQSK